MILSINWLWLKCANDFCVYFPFLAYDKINGYDFDYEKKPAFGEAINCHKKLSFALRKKTYKKNMKETKVESTLAICSSLLVCLWISFYASFHNIRVLVLLDKFTNKFLNKYHFPLRHHLLNLKAATKPIKYRQKYSTYFKYLYFFFIFMK